MLLNEFARQGYLNPMPANYAYRTATHTIEIDQDGKPIHPDLLIRENKRESEDGKARTIYGDRLLLPIAYRTNNILPILLCDDAKYTLGIERGQQYPDHFSAAQALINDCARKTQEPAILAIQRFYKTYTPSMLSAHIKKEIQKSNAEGMLLNWNVHLNEMIIDPVTIPAVQAYWKNHIRSVYAGPIERCMICGKIRETSRIFPAKVSLRGAPNGVSISSINEESFISYGKINITETPSIPTCHTCADLTCRGLRILIQKGVVFGDTTIIFWAHNNPESEDSFRLTFDAPDPREMQDLIQRIRHGQQPNESGAHELGRQFSTATLSYNKTRLVITDWTQDSAEQTIEHMLAWANAISLDRVSPKSLALWRLIKSIENQDQTKEQNQRTTRPVIRSLLQTMTSGQPIPDVIIQKVIQQCLATGTVNQQHAALLKAYNAYTPNERRYATMTSLNDEEQDPCYLIGRLYAICEYLQNFVYQNDTFQSRHFRSIQNSTLFNINAIMNGQINHIRICKRRKVRNIHIVENLITDLYSRINGKIPHSFTPKQSSVFMLGYYQQKQNIHRLFHDKDIDPSAPTTTTKDEPMNSDNDLGQDDDNPDHSLNVVDDITSQTEERKSKPNPRQKNPKKPMEVQKEQAAVPELNVTNLPVKQRRSSKPKIVNNGQTSFEL